MIDVYKGMNEPQREAIAHVDGPLLVVAGAGSGKTRVITHRIANLIQLGNRPDRILAITFTNKAAGEMQDRVHRLLGLKTPWITTFHSAGLRLLKIESHRLGFQHPFTVMDEEEQRKKFKRIYKELKLDTKVIDPRKVQWRISHWKNQLTKIDQVVASDDTDEWAKQCHVRYAEICKEECVVDFDDLLIMPVRMFEADEQLRQKYVERFPYILVDEYQDTNKAQYRLIQLLGAHRNICATGDPDQAIYGWRGADIENILNFEKDFSGCKVVLLEENYRSTKAILRAAQGVVSHNEKRKDKTIRTSNEEGKPLMVLAVDDEMDESFAIAAAIERMYKEGQKLSDIAVFYRTNAQSRVLEDGMRRRGLPYRIVGGTRFYDRREVKDLLAYLKLLINPRDRDSFERIANIPKRGIGEKSLEALYQIADDETVGPLEVLESTDLLERVAVGRNSNPMRDLSRAWRLVRALPLSNPTACVRGVIELVNLEEHYRATEDSGEAQERIANVREVITAAEQYHEASPEGGLAGFLELVSLVTEPDLAKERSRADQITLMTLHSAKGLEFPVVFITGCEDGVLPLKRMGETADLEEERRLMYVGITRAMKHLYLSRARCRMQYGQTFRNQPSQFLDEIPSDCFQGKDATGRHAVPEASKPMSARYRNVAQAMRSGALMKGSDLKRGGDSEAHVLEDDPHLPGERVVHSIFGRGAVVAMKGPREGRSIIIDFDQHGRKELQMSFTAGKLSCE
ncbi:MAG: UvrD-helicase domain-containing protein [Planctomycetes bacterium]|nr:UvrD-helicase domain-containing protein [Planctomycetota bacterium]